MTFLEVYVFDGFVALGFMTLLLLVSLALRYSSIVNPYKEYVESTNTFVPWFPLKKLGEG